MNRLKPERIGGPECGRDVAEIAQPFDHQTHRVAPVLHHPPEPLLPHIQYVRIQSFQNLSAVEISIFPAAELIEVWEPPTAALVCGLRAALHFHQASDVVFLLEQLLHGVLRRILRWF